ncbi:glycosyltransferase [Cohnella nanjingensis]|uniref:Glycosyltransferase n=1 Tax=Cohnella nanjingensis TaxID=1387779 RepID=A0A7X0RN70_9BACL|nr:glycosyltransferase [Cohnella nanjingensis]MBB6670619.1 glycosyltransferase [Cohnella nanjingensis]
MNKIVILSPDSIEVKMAGPAIRYWNIAKELSKHLEVTLFTPNNCLLKADFPVIEFSRKVFIEHAKKADAIIIQGTKLWESPYIKKLGIPLIIDLYDPFIFENFEMFSDSTFSLNMHQSSLTILLDQLKHGDFFICASEKQRDFWLGMLSAINRINPKEYEIDKTFYHLIDIVPFGLSEEIPTKTEQVLKGVYPGINRDDKVILWGGGLWDWLDPLTAIRAISKICEQRSDVKLFFMGTVHPNANLADMTMVTKAMDLSNSLGLTDKYVFFNEWVDYNKRHNYLLEADIGLSLHFNHIETRFSFRTRILDYIWCDLPVISTEGDILSEYVTVNKIGLNIPCEDADTLAETINKMLSNLNDYVIGPNLKKQFYWQQCVQPLVKDRYLISTGKNEQLSIRGSSKFSFYFVKLHYYFRKKQYSFLIRKIFNTLKSRFK